MTGVVGCTWAGLFGEPGKAAPIYAELGFADLAPAATWTLKVPTLAYRGTSFIKKRLPLGPCSVPMPRALWWSWAGGCFLMSEVPL